MYECEISVNYTTLQRCQSWQINEALEHDSKSYFSIVCVEDREHNESIFILQRKIGILGFIVSKTAQGFEWLVQNKPEPGNIFYYQYAPTVQATKCNYEQVHQGSKTLFLEYFLQGKLCVDVCGSEQGSKFLGKFNRNCKIVVDKSKINFPSKNYSWLTSKQIKQLLRKSFVLNTDARSVIVCGSWNWLASDSKLFAEIKNPVIAQALRNSYQVRDKQRIKNAISFLQSCEKQYEYDTIPLKNMRTFKLTPFGIQCIEKRQCKVCYFDIRMEREVSHWQQPLVMDTSIQQSWLIFSIKNSISYFFLQVNYEMGFDNGVEFGPSLQTNVSFTAKDIDVVKNTQTLAQIDQSDEGGRFYQNIMRYTLAYWPHQQHLCSLKNGLWLTAGEIENMTLMKGYLTNELRSLLSLLVSFM
ncbi:NDP-hexose 2,3-dehydratase family protein [Candidatus Uabimicrobium amorphum]|uniref:NDP-hexose 2,3-dehydratase n=1 Tax=Uabimicrobium amorphum TaxID=2596890 RepID=A0A5S9F635_UABAM|nr:NDP-hexose 2,3-dehydratase family protein [Candidatus Uabimicrobium amorphum]BBM87485.1 NDP-hexose 2,3-dehydratase [Candidatus Uabimicrobium amorphum]